jgi:hypothetical protein
VPFCTSPANNSPSFPFASLVIPLTKIYSINFLQIVPQTTDCLFTESVASFPFYYVAVNVEQTTKNCWEEGLALIFFKCFRVLF